MSIDLCTISDVRAYLSMSPSVVKSTRVTAGGSGYTSITITAQSVDGNGSGATFAGVLVGGALTAITILAPGSGYTIEPILSITGNGTGATGICFIGDDLSISRLISRASSYFLDKTNRPLGILPVALTERRNGNDAPVIVTYWWPITLVTSVVVNGVTVPASSNGSAGWVNDNKQIMLVSGSVFGRGASGLFYAGYQNVTIAYTFGFATVPDDIVQAVIEIVAQKYLRAQHFDQVSQRSADGQVVTFRKGDVPEESNAVINQYRIKSIIE